MKLRFRQNSLRLRVNRTEVEQLAAGSLLSEEIRFPGATRIAYVLETTTQASAAATYDADIIRISAPHRQVTAWAHSEDIGLYFELPAGDVLLRIAIEKDLECIDGPAAERDPHAYPRSADPAATC